MSKSNVLLTYDDPQMLGMISWSLRDRGFDVTSTASVHDAVDRLRQQHFDVVISQLVMNPEDGFEVLKQAKEIDPETIVIMLGGEEIAQFDCDGLPQEADEYVFTPCGIPQIWRRVQKCLEALDLKRRDAHCKASRKKLVELGKEMKRVIDGSCGEMDPAVSASLTRQLETVYELIGRTNAMLDDSFYMEKQAGVENTENTIRV